MGCWQIVGIVAQNDAQMGADMIASSVSDFTAVWVCGSISMMAEASNSIEVAVGIPVDFSESSSSTNGKTSEENGCENL